MATEREIQGSLICRRSSDLTRSTRSVVVALPRLNSGVHRRSRIGDAQGPVSRSSIITQRIDHGEDSGRERARIVGCDCETMLGGDRRCSRREWGRLQAWGGGGRGGAESRKSYSIV
jgi:hypothetical protein